MWTPGFFGSGEAAAPDGDRVWVAGGFNAAAPRTGPGIAVDSAGTRIAGYAELTDPAGTPVSADAAISDGSGGWYVGGNFNKAGGVARPGLVHLFANGSVDPAFNAQATAGTVKALVLSGSNLYAAGTFTTIGGLAQNSVAELDATTGTANGAWTPSITAGGVIRSLSLDGSVLYAAGNFASGALSNLIAINAATGVVNAGFNPNPSGGLINAVVASGGSVFVGGSFTTVFGAAHSRLVKIDPAGPAVVTAWAPAPNGLVNALATDGTDLYIGGGFSSLGGATRRQIAAVPLGSTTGNATGWYPGDVTAGSSVNVIALDAANVYFGGNFTDVGGSARFGLASAAIGGTGALTGWNPAPNGFPSAIAPTPAAVYVGGQFTGMNSVPRTALMAVDLLSGQPMPFFSHTISGLGGTIYAVAACGSSVYIGGSFSNVDGQVRINAAAFDRNTGALTAWNPDLDNDVDAIACGNGVVYLGGIFQFFNTSTTNLPARGGLAGTDPTTGAATSWDPGVGGGATSVSTLAVRGSTVYVGGGFANLGGLARSNLAAIDATTGTATSWNPSVTGSVTSIALGQSDLYVVGNLTQVGATPRTRAAAVALSDGSVDPGWNPAPDALVYSVTAAPDGTVYMGGTFANVGGQPRSHLAAVSATGAVTGWNPGPDNTVYGLSAGSDGRLYVSGAFSGFAGRASGLFSSFSEPTSFASQPALTSAPTDGQATTCDPGTPGGSLPAPQTIQWRLDGADIGGATGTSYTPSTSDVGHALSCHVSQRNLISTAQADSAAMTVASAPVAPAATPPPAPFDIDGQPTPPPPVRGRSVIVEPVSGTVTVLLPGFKTFIPLPDAERIPVGTVIDARHGVVKLTSVGKNGKLQSAIFYEGVFQVFQGTGRSAITELRLYGGNFAVCKNAKKAAVLVAGAIPKSKSIRHLWGKGKGLFRTRGRYASATIRGTTWLTDDRCDGTLVRVKQGSVTVRDLPKRKSLVLKAPNSYLARAR